jgi:recombination protein RecA
MTKEDIETALDEAKKSMKGMALKGDDPSLQLIKESFDIPVLDSMLKGGLKRKGITILTGAFSTCKSFLAQKAIAAIQKKGGSAVYIDTEGRYDPEWFTLTGVDITKLDVIQPEYGEEAVDVALSYLKAGIDMLVFDSFAGLVPMEEYAAGMEQKFMGLQARMLNKAIKKMNPVNKNSVPYGGGMQEKLVGGVGQYFHASLILQTRRKGWLLETKDGKIVEDEKASKKAKKVGFVISCVVQKSNYCPPHVSCDIPFNFYSGQLDNLASIVDLAVDSGKILRAGAWYKYKKEKFMGMQSVCKYFESNPGEFDTLQKEVLNAAN